jgi:hypothetical protein
MENNGNLICSECGQISKSKKFDTYGEFKLRTCPNCGAISKYESSGGVSNVKSILLTMFILMMGKII